MQQAGCQQILTKPVSEQALLQALAPYLAPFQSKAATSATLSSAYDDLQLSFLARLTEVQQQLSTYRQQSAHAQLLLLLHKTKGTAACLEFTELASLAKAAESSLRQQRPASTELDELQQHIESLQKYAPPGSSS